MHSLFLDQIISAIRQLYGKTMAMFLDKNSAPVLADSLLCETCSALNLVQMFREVVKESHPVNLDALTTVLSKKHICGLCGLISHLISRSWLLDRHTGEDLTSVQVQLLVVPCGISSFIAQPACAHRILVRAGRPIAIHRTVLKENLHLTMELQMMEDDAARFGRERAYHGRRVGAVVNFTLIREWMRICEEEHGPTCANGWRKVSEQLPQGARMIDVVQMAVVEAPQGCRYVALSYVWGNINTEYKTVSTNLAQRRQRGSLERVALPTSISDAIKVVRELGERYLWVDAMCIIQEDGCDDKATQIAGMHIIYGAAALTIFAVGGDLVDAGADDPLPGLELGSRQQLQRIESIQSLRLAVPLRTLNETLTASKWNSRGWTYQEYILSRRGLFFTNEQLFFKCNRDVFAEDIIVESSKDTAMYPGKYDGLGLDKLHSIRNRKDQQRRYQSYSDAFMQIVKEYTRRQLSVDKDIYNAIFAINTVFSRDLEITPLDPNTAFLFGMPMSVLEDAMLWQPALDAPAHVRRREKGLVTPSWSWAGWKGSVVYFDLTGFMKGSPGARRSLVNEWVIVDPDKRARRIARGRQLEYNWVQTDKYRRPSSPPGASLVDEGESLAPGTLLFYTTVALLRVRKVANQIDDGPVYVSKFYSVFEILSETSPPAKMGRVVLPADTGTTVPLEFAVLSRSKTGFDPETYDEQVFGIYYVGCLLNVMVVKLVGKPVDGKEVSERVGVGVIVEAAWAASRFREQVVRLQ